MANYPIKELSESAAKLLLVYLTAIEEETVDDGIARAGIKTWRTYQKAHEELKTAQFLYIDEDGHSFLKTENNYLSRFESKGIKK